MEYIKCMLCGSKEYFQKIHEINNRFNFKEKYQIQTVSLNYLHNQLIASL